MRISEVLPIAPPPNWPALPEVPDGLEGPFAEDRVPDDQRTYARTTCPSCGVELQPLPRAKKRCRECGADIYVKSGLRGVRHLLAERELDAFERQKRADADARYDAIEAEWQRRLVAAGFQTGEYELDVVGESRRHAALAGIKASITSDWDTYEVRTSAVLVREPSNQYDRNAVAVYINGEMVGYLGRDDAEDYQPCLKRAGASAFVVEATLRGGRPDGVFVGPIGVTLVSIPDPDLH